MGTEATPTSDAPTTGAANPTPLTLCPDAPQLTLRGVLTGALLGAVLSVCNIYAGLKLGMVFNMSIVAALLGYGFWAGVEGLSGGRVRRFDMLENNINQTGCSAAAYVPSAGLVTAIPALALLTGQTLSWPVLAGWLLVVCLLGNVIAVGLRRQMIVAEKLPFAVGIAGAETLRGLHARECAAAVSGAPLPPDQPVGYATGRHGREAAARIEALLVGAAASACLAVSTYVARIGTLAAPGALRGLRLSGLTFGLSTSPLLPAVGGLIGFRTCASLLLGSIVAFGLIAPPLLADGTMRAATYPEMVTWLVWPGVTMMVVAALVSLAFSWRALATGVARLFTSQPGPGSLQRRSPYALALGASLVTVIGIQVLLFAVPWWVAAVGVLLAFILALGAARVAGETGMNPIAPVAKLTQLAVGALLPQSPAANLMAANVTSGAASQCADLLSDLKCGALLGAAPRAQTIAQLCGAAAGACAAAFAYTLLVPNPATQLLTEELPAPGVRGVMVVAELFQGGFRGLPAGTPLAMLIAALVAVALTLGERLAPARARRWVPSTASVGMAFVFPASVSAAIFLGGLVALLLGKWCRDWSSRFLITVCTGLIVGDTLTSVGTSIHTLLSR